MASAPTSEALPPDPGLGGATVALGTPFARSRERRFTISRPWRDAIVVALVTLASAVVSVEFNLNERIHQFTASWERIQLDELPGVLWVLSVGLAWYAVRRYRDAGRDLERRRIAEAQLGAVLADNRRLSQQYVDLQESERKALARELHDELGQYLNVIKLDAVGIRDARLLDAQGARDRAGAIAENCNHIHSVLADLIGKLRPVGLDELGLAAAVEHCLEAWRPRLSGVELSLAVRGEWTDLPEDVALTAYRVVQEALTNVAKHASARSVSIELDRQPGVQSGTDMLLIAVVDDGVGRRPSESSRGLGLIGMKERVTALKGELHVESAPGGGFQLTARLPVSAS
jgi:two-component system, NarL family, sensor histidine kinase UhpB